MDINNISIPKGAMEEKTEFIVYITMLTWKQLSEKMFELEIQEPPMRSSKRKMMDQFSNIQVIFDVWMKVLTPDERYVVKRHLIDGVKWNTVVSEYNHVKKNTSPKSSVVFYKLQSSAIYKMAKYIEKNEMRRTM